MIKIIVFIVIYFFILYHLGQLKRKEVYYLKFEFQLENFKINTNVR